MCRCSVMKRATEPKTLQHWTTWLRHLNGPWWAMNREGSIQRKLGGIARRRRTLVAVKHFQWTNLCVLTFAVGLVRSMRFERVTYFKYEVEERFRFHFWSAWLFGNMMATFSRSKLEDYINVACNWTFKPKKTIWRMSLAPLASWQTGPHFSTIRLAFSCTWKDLRRVGGGFLGIWL